MIEYTFNNGGQPELDRVTTLGGSTDGYVRSIKREYDSLLGRLEKITSYSESGGTGTVRNQVVQGHADYGPVATEWQSHSGAAVTTGGSQSPKVQYGFDTDATSSIYQDGLRLQQLTYPNGRVIYYQYGTAADDLNDLLGRVSHVRNADGNGQLLVQYTRLGSGQVVKVDYDEPDLRLDLLPGGTAGDYDGLDRFGRVKDLLWRNYGNSTDAVRIKHGYDYAGNRVYREDTVSKGQGTPVYLDEYYTYDGLNQLKNLKRGQLNGNKDAISGTPTKEEDWTLDALGNWSTYVKKTSGSEDLNQSRTHNLANELTQIAGSSTHVAEDAAGNMTRIPKPGVWNDHLHLVYDAWNRLVEVRAADDSTLVAKYEFDGRNFRTVKKTYTGGQLSETRHFYYNSSWQVLEERVGESPSFVGANRQYVWGDRYIDDLILRERDTNADGTLDERLHVMQDANWNVVAVANTGGDVQERYVYTAYGAPTVLTGTFGSRASTSYAWDYLYTGRQYDPETGLYHYRNRFYGAELGRFPTRDPIGYDGGINLYEYVGDSPLIRIDPSGKFWPYVIGGAAVAAAVTISACCLADMAKIRFNTNKIIDGIHAKWPPGYSTQGEGTPYDALQHCIGACEANQHPGSCGSSAVARAGVNYFETYQGQQFDTQSDLANNASGFAITGDCTTGCLKALKEHNLLCTPNPDGVTFACPSPP